MLRLLILGLSYTAMEWINHSNLNDFQISATSSNPEKQPYCKNQKITLLKHNDSKLSKAIKNAHVILISAPPNTNGNDYFFHTIKQHIQIERILWIGYLSSTSVYGDQKGQWVNEASALIGTTTNGLRRIQAESQWLNMRHIWPIHIFRLSGIYGPKRNAIERLIHGKTSTIIKKNHVFSRVHVADIAQVLSASLNQPTPGEIYNIADDYPCAASIIDDYAADLLKIPHTLKKKWSEAIQSPMLKQFYQCSRRVDNSKIKKALGVQLIYPSYKEGLQAIWHQMQNPS